MRTVISLSLAIVAAMILGGCTKGDSRGPAPAEIKAFEAATPAVKQIWQAALEADRTNDFARGLGLYYSLLREDLTSEQHDAVGRLSTSLKQRLSDAAQKGDATAQAALQELRQRTPGRP